MADKRIFNLTEATTAGDNDLLALDNSNFPETKKIKVSKLKAADAQKLDITSLYNLTGTTNTTGSTIHKGTFFYLNGSLSVALADIAPGATFTFDTNYVATTVGDELTDVKQTLSDISENGIINSNYRIKNIDFDIYWTGDASPTGDWTTQNATDAAKAIYNAFKDCGGIAGTVFTGKLNFHNRKASDGSQLGSSTGWYTLYSSPTYNQMIADNAVTRLSFDYRLYGNTMAYKYGLWGNHLMRSTHGMSSNGTLADVDAMLTYTTISS